MSESSTIISAVKTIPLPNAFAETLRETLEEWPGTQKEIAGATGIPASHLSEMKAGRRRCTPEYDLRLSRYFSMDPGFWMRLQLHFEIQRTQLELGEKIDAEVHPAA